MISAQTRSAFVARENRFPPRIKCGACFSGSCSRTRISVARRRDGRRAQALGLFRTQRPGIERQHPDQDQADQINDIGLRRRGCPAQETPRLPLRTSVVFHALVLREMPQEGKRYMRALQDPGRLAGTRSSAASAARLRADDTIRIRLPITSISSPNSSGAAACAIRAGAPIRPSR